MSIEQTTGRSYVSGGPDGCRGAAGLPVGLALDPAHRGEAGTAAHRSCAWVRQAEADVATRVGVINGEHAEMGRLKWEVAILALSASRSLRPLSQPRRAVPQPAGKLDAVVIGPWQQAAACDTKRGI